MTKRLPEQKLNDRVRAALGGFDPRRCENRVDPGTPDVHYIGGWIEDKVVKRWPRKGAVLKVPHYTSKQRGWHMRRRAAGGRVHVAIEVAGELHVFDADIAARHLGLTWTREDMKLRAAHYQRDWDAGKFRRFIEQCACDGF